MYRVANATTFATTVVASNLRLRQLSVATDLRQNAVASCRKGLVAGLILGSEQGSTGSMTDSKVDHSWSRFRATEPFHHSFKTCFGTAFLDRSTLVDLVNTRSLVKTQIFNQVVATTFATTIRDNFCDNKLSQVVASRKKMKKKLSQIQNLSHCQPCKLHSKIQISINFTRSNNHLFQSFSIP